jgi:hypothetical protein
MFGDRIGHTFGGSPGYCDQDNRYQHAEDVLYGPIPDVGVFHGLIVELHKRAHEIGTQTEQELNVREDEQQEAQQVIGLTERLFAGKTDQRIDDDGYKHEKYKITHPGMRRDQEGLHGNKFWMAK